MTLIFVKELKARWIKPTKQTVYALGIPLLPPQVSCDLSGPVFIWLFLSRWVTQDLQGSTLHDAAAWYEDHSWFRLGFQFQHME